MTIAASSPVPRARFAALRQLTNMSRTDLFTRVQILVVTLALLAYILLPVF